MNCLVRARKLRSKERCGRNQRALRWTKLYVSRLRWSKILLHAETLLRLTHSFQIADARTKVSEADAKIGAKASEVDAKLQQLAADGKTQLKDTGRELKQTADNFDHLVEKKASEAKSGISSWFGFGK